MKRKILFVLGIFLLFSPFLVKADSFESEDNSDYFMIEPDNEDEEDVKVFPFLKNNNFLANDNSEDYVFPSKYDLRNVDGKNYVTGIKNQNPLGLCAAFATVSSIETNMLKMGISSEDNPVILSERQIDYLTSNPNEAFLEGVNPYDYKLKNFSNSFSNSNNYLSLAWAKEFRLISSLFTVGISPVESKGYWSNYCISESGSMCNGNSMEEYMEKITLANAINDDNVKYSVVETDSLPSKKYVKNMNSEDRQAYINLIKQHIMDYGSLYVHTMSPKAFDSNGNVQSGSCAVEDILDGNGDYIDSLIDDRGHKKAECGISSFPGHAMSIIGWDDDFVGDYCIINKISQGNYEEDGKKYPMTSEYCTANNGSFHEVRGAWILKNSWGYDDKDENGNVIRKRYEYPYLAYDSYIVGLASVNKTILRDWDNNYSELDATEKESSNTEFNRTFTKKDNGKIEGIVRIMLDTSFTSYSKNEDVNEYTVYLRRDEQYVELGKINTKFKGISSLEVPNVFVNDDFSVKVVAENPLTYDSYGKAEYVDITVFTKNIIPIEEVKIEDVDPIIKKGDSRQLNAILLPTNERNKDIVWSSGDTSIVTISNDGVIYGVGEGKTTITATHSDSLKEASLEVIVYDKLMVDSNYYANNLNIFKIPEKLAYDEFVSKSLFIDGSSLKLFDSGNKEIDNFNVFKTGMKLKVIRNNEEEVYDLSVIGDVNGDGKVNSLDLVNVLNHISRKKELKNIYEVSGDMNSDNKVNAVDLSRMLNHIAGKVGY